MNHEAENLFSWFDAPAYAKDLLYQAVLHWEDTPLSREYIMMALDKSDDDINVLTAAYRFFFYKQDYSMALQLALKVMEKVRSAKGLPESYKIGELFKALRENIEYYDVRMFINAYAAYAFILLKLGNIEKATEILEFLKCIDVNGEFGVPIMLDIISKPREEEDEYEY
jgi:tetratricopeptide (TPR) repeat protein